MNTSESIYKGEMADIANVNVDLPLREAQHPCCEYYIDTFGKAAKKAEESSEFKIAAVYWFLRELTGFQATFDTPSQPFGPMWVMNGRRAPIPSDLTPKDRDAIKQIVAQTSDSALSARLNDVLWLLEKNYLNGIEAAKAYISTAQKLNSPENWPNSLPCFQRGLYLAARFGRGKELFQDSANAVESAARASATSTEANQCAGLMEILFRYGIGDPAEFAAIAGSRADEALTHQNLFLYRTYREAEADWHGRAKNQDARKAARLLAAETYITEAESRSQGPGASYMAAAGILARGIEAMRQAGATKERIESLRQKLNEYQRNSRSEFKTFSTSVDISKLVNQARESVQTADFAEAVLRLAFGQDVANVAELKQAVKKMANDAPLSHLMNSVTVDEQGRVTHRKTGILSATPAEHEKALTEEAFAHAANTHWPLRVQAFIEPARLQILNDHQPTFASLSFLVHQNPFVPPGHEPLFLRGIFSGFHGEWEIAAHLLVPQIENSLRFVLENNGTDVSNLYSDGTQPVKVLGAIFDLSATTQIFGENLCFELRGHLIEKSGYDFRNRIAHGFTSFSECYSPAAVGIWWLLLRILAYPIYQRMNAEKSANK